MSSVRYGRKKILTDIVLNGNVEHDEKLIPIIIEKALPTHRKNQEVYKVNEDWYFNNTEKILSKVKYNRTEIDNRFTFATAKSVVDMNNGYCFGEPLKYVVNEAEVSKQEQMQAFNKCLQAVGANKSMLECAKNSAIFGISYKLALRPTEQDLSQGKYFKIVSDINNYNTFMVYQNTIEKEEVLGVTYYERKKIDANGNTSDDTETVFNCWTKYHQWTFVKDGNDYIPQLFNIKFDKATLKLKAYPLSLSVDGKVLESQIPLQEYERTDDRVGDFELSIKLMDAINILASCRVDSVQQNTDYIIKLRDIDLGEFDENGVNPTIERIKMYMQEHMLAFDSRDGADVQPDIDVLDIPLNQSEVQTLQNFLFEMLMEELQQPTRNGGTGQDTGVAVENRNGFRQFENKAVSITEYAIASEKKFLSKLLEIGKSFKNCPFKDISIADISIKSMRNRSENITTSTNNYREMRNAGVNPYTAYSVSGLVADIPDTIKLDKQWKEYEAQFEIEVERKKANINNKTNEVNSIDNVDEQKTD